MKAAVPPGADRSVHIVDAALPAAQITTEVLAPDSKGLPLMDEFVLRLVDHQVTRGNSIAGMLGPPERMVDQTVAALFSSDDLRWPRPAPPATTPPYAAVERRDEASP